jgi:hypothetical protein
VGVTGFRALPVDGADIDTLAKRRLPSSGASTLSRMTDRQLLGYLDESRGFDVSRYKRSGPLGHPSKRCGPWRTNQRAQRTGRGAR